ncbi:hypothetical protein [Pedobacter sp. ASV12]|uniref:hypothetical protein n=1 Tax=Pedobacter sp. ASV12 TaxID=2795120 RepID=UPI0018ED7B64|nr:hypothetical protein [Pedobacter sp. ASV12]
MENKEFREIAAQFRHPSGAKRSEMAVMTNKTKIGMTMDAIKNLVLKTHDQLSETIQYLKNGKPCCSTAFLNKSQ